MLLEWSVPLATGGREATVEGETLWIPGESPVASSAADPGGFFRAPVVAAGVVAAAAVIVAVWVGRRVGSGRRRRP